MGEFLVANGDHAAFTRCSVPNVLHRAANAGKTALAQAVETAWPQPGAPMLALVIDWKRDPELKEVLAHPAVNSAGVSQEWIRKSRWGEILYHHYRCGWLHEASQSPELGTEFPDEPGDEPRYQNRLYVHDVGPPTTRRLPTFPVPFLLRTYERAIDSLERAMLALDPYVALR
jgi:hypothetical protein